MGIRIVTATTAVGAAAAFIWTFGSPAQTAPAGEEQSLAVLQSTENTERAVLNDNNGNS